MLQLQMQRLLLPRATSKHHSLREDERLIHYPDVGLFHDGKTKHHLVGDRRLVMAHFLAHQVAKTQWPLYRCVLRRQRQSMLLCFWVQMSAGNYLSEYVCSANGRVQADALWGR